MNLSSLVTLLVESFLPEAHQKYLFLNYSQSSQYRTYKSFVPEYLKGRPHSVILHCLNRKGKALKYSSDDVKLVDEQAGIFEVKGSKDKTHIVTFGLQSKDKMPQCSCLDWKQWNLPCKHFFCIFRIHPRWNWNTFSQAYLQSPYLTLDEESLSNCFGGDSSMTGPMVTVEETAICDGNDTTPSSDGITASNDLRLACPAMSSEIPRQKVWY